MEETKIETVLCIYCGAYHRAKIGEAPESYEIRYEDENIWLSQKMMAELYDVDIRTINYHIKKIFSDGELDEFSVIRKYWITPRSLINMLIL